MTNMIVNESEKLYSLMSGLEIKPFPYRQGKLEFRTVLAFYKKWGTNKAI